MSKRYGVIALARTTFDMEFAEEMKNDAFATLDASGIDTVGPRSLACDADAAAQALAQISAAGSIDLLLILQVTFTDATMTIRMARESSAPVALWGLPEPRLGGRLRLNAYCGINLAAHALGKAGLPYAWLFAAPDAADIHARLRSLANSTMPSRAAVEAIEPAEDDLADRVIGKLREGRVSVVGQHPDGFDTCAYNAAELSALTGISIDRVSLDDAFAKAKDAPAARAGAHRAQAAASLAGRHRRRRPGATRSIIAAALCARGHRRGKQGRQPGRSLLARDFR